MEIEVLQKDDSFVSLLIRGVDVAFINTVRRLILAEVPVMAIDEVVMIENSSILQDEIIAHRLGLIPLKTDLESYNLPEECQCKSEFGCSLCRVSFVLDVEATEETRTVYSGELQSENPDVIPVSNKIPLLKLAKGQKIKLEAYARLGKGKNHAKWQPVSKCTYKYFPQIHLKNNCNSCGKCVEICPKKVFKITNNTIKVINLRACNLCQDCVEICPQSPPAIEIGWEEDSFIFYLESTKALKPERIVIEAIDLLDNQLTEFGNQVQAIKDEKN